MLDLSLLFQDRNLVVLNKPAGIPVIPGRDGGDSLQAQTGWRVIHRLDQDTTGCLAMARSLAAQRILSEAFATQKVEKHYLAVASRDIGPDPLEVTTPLGEWKNGRVAIGAGKAARTRFTRLALGDGWCLVVARPFTGRTHQIRAHLATLRAPLIGDPAYGGPDGPRPLLHAWSLTLPWPTAGRRLTTVAPPPPDFAPYLPALLEPPSEAPSETPSETPSRTVS